jgi:DNA-directed RNA polymerase subunit RPC12/RpoP
MFHRPVDVQRIVVLLDALDAVVLTPAALPLGSGDRMEPQEADIEFEYFCPVCGVELGRSNFDTPERDYYCPHCSTRSTPSAVAVA